MNDNHERRAARKKADEAIRRLKLHKGKGYADLGSLDEDERIEAIVQTARTRPGKMLAVCCDNSDIIVDRYIQKIVAREPLIDIIDKTKDGPVPGVRMIQLVYLMPKGTT